MLKLALFYLFLCALHFDVVCAKKSLKGGAVTTATKTKKRFSKRYMLQAFCFTLFDPTFQGQIKIRKPRRSKGKKSRRLGGVDNFSMGGGGATFGPVCGPNGCH